MIRETAPTMRPTDWALLIVLSVLWGGSFFLAAVALEDLPPFTVVIGRAGIAALTLLIVLRAMGLVVPRDPRLWAAFCVVGALNNMIPFSLICWAQTRIESGLASILNAATPLFAAVLAHWLTRDEKLTPNKLVGVIVGIGGVATMVGLESLGGLSVNVVAELACLAAALSYAFAGIFGRTLKGVPFLVVAFGQATATTAMLAPVVLIVDRPWTLPMPGAEAWGAAIGLGVLCTAVGHSLYFRILSTAGATNVLLVTLLVPVSAIWLGWSILGERLGWHQFAGMALIGVGLVVIDGRAFRFIGRRLFASRP